VCHVTASFFVAAGAYTVGRFGFGVATVNIFPSLHPMMLTALDEYFNNCFEWLTVAWRFA